MIIRVLLPFSPVAPSLFRFSSSLVSSRSLGQVPLFPLVFLVLKPMARGYRTFLGAQMFISASGSPGKTSKAPFSASPIFIILRGDPSNDFNCQPKGGPFPFSHGNLKNKVPLEENLCVHTYAGVRATDIFQDMIRYLMEQKAELTRRSVESSPDLCSGRFRLGQSQVSFLQLEGGGRPSRGSQNQSLGHRFS